MGRPSRFSPEVRDRRLESRTSRWCLLGLALVALSGCDDGEECRANTDRIQQRLEALPDGPSATVPAGIDPPQAHGEPLVRHVPDLVIEADGDLVLNGQPLDSADEIERRLRVSNEQRRQFQAPEWAPAIHVWADRSVRYAQVQRVLASLQTRESWLLVVAEQSEAPPPCPPQLGEVCDPPSDPSSRATVMAEGLSSIVEDCEPLTRLFTRLATMDPDEKTAAFRRGFPAGVRECDCDMDMAAIEYFAVELAGGNGPRVTRMRLGGANEGTVADWVAARAGS